VRRLLDASRLSLCAAVPVEFLERRLLYIPPEVPRASIIATDHIQRRCPQAGRLAARLVSQTADGSWHGR